MASVLEIVDGSYSEDASGSRWTRAWIVQATGTRTGSAMYEATQLGDIPRIGDQHPDKPDIRLDNIDASPVEREPTQFRIVGTYTTNGGAESSSEVAKRSVTFELSYRREKWDFKAVFQKGDDGLIPPDATEGNGIEFYEVLEPRNFAKLGWTLDQVRDSNVKVEFDGATYDRTTYFDRHNNFLRVDYRGKYMIGYGWKNLKANVPIRTSRAIVTVSRETYRFADVAEYLGTVNKKKWSGFPARTWRIDRIAGDGRALRAPT